MTRKEQEAVFPEEVLRAFLVDLKGHFQGKKYEIIIPFTIDIKYSKTKVKNCTIKSFQFLLVAQSQIFVGLDPGLPVLRQVLLRKLVENVRLRM